MIPHDIERNGRWIPGGKRVRKVDVPCSDELSNPPPDRYLAAHIENYHATRLMAWELAFVRSLAACQGDLNAQQGAALSSIWQRIQGGRAV